jgi:hypothetical protein
MLSGEHARGAELVADVIYIRKNENPPEDEDWVLLERTPSGKYVGRGSVAHRQSATFYRPAAEDREAAISRAIAWADSYGVLAIYVRDSEDDA